jgi:hypothetical protein
MGGPKRAAMGIAYRTDGPGGVSVSVWVDNVTRKRALQHVVDLAAEPDWGARAEF